MTRVREWDGLSHEKVGKPGHATLFDLTEAERVQLASFMRGSDATLIGRLIDQEAERASSQFILGGDEAAKVGREYQVKYATLKAFWKSVEREANANKPA